MDRVKDSEDSRQVRIRLTPRGAGKLRRLSDEHRQELSRTGPLLVEAPGKLLPVAESEGRR